MKRLDIGPLVAGNLAGEAAGLELRRLVRACAAQPGRIAGCLLLAALLGALYALLSQPVYEANLMLQVEEPVEARQGLMGDASALFEIKAEAAGEVEVLRSRRVVLPAVQVLHRGIRAVPKRFPLIGRALARYAGGLSTPGVFGWGGYAWGRESIVVSRLDVPASRLDQVFELTVLGAQRYALRVPGYALPVTGEVGVPLRIDLTDGSVILAVDHMLAQPGASFMLARQSDQQALDALQRALFIQELGKRSGVISLALRDEDPRRAADTLNQIATEYLRQSIERKEREARHALATLDETLVQLRVKLQTAEGQYSALRTQYGAADLVEEARVLIKRSTDARAEWVALRQKRAELAARFAAEHPSIQAVDAQIAEQSRELSRLDTRLQALPRQDELVQRAARDVRVNSELVQSLALAIQQVKLVGTGKARSVRVVDASIAPETPVKPKRLAVIAVSALAGGVLGVAWVVMRELFRRGVHWPAEIEEATGERVCGVVPRADPPVGSASVVPMPANLVASHAPYSPAGKALVGVAATLRFMMQSAGAKAIGVGGASAGSGAAFLAVNLAAMLANQGQRVLLIDAAGAPGRVHAWFDVPSAQGWCDALQGNSALKAYTHETTVHNVDVLPCGVQPYALPHYATKRLSSLLAEAVTRYDMVLLVLPAILAGGDAQALVPAANWLLLTARAGRDGATELREAVHRWRLAGGKVMGTVLNDVPSLIQRRATLAPVQRRGASA